MRSLVSYGISIKSLGVLFVYMGNIESNYKLLLQESPSNYLILSPELIIVSVSDAYLKASGKNREEIVGKYLFDILPSQHFSQLEQMNEKLLHSNEELEQIVYIASHDLQQPLRTISNYIELINEEYEGSIEENVNQYLRFIANSTVKMRNLIKDLLDYSRVGARINVETVDTNIVIKDVIEDLAASITEKKAKITFKDLPVIKGDDIKLHQLFQNLLSNAIKFHRKDITPEIKVEVEKTDNGNIFSIIDNGIGIEQEYLTRLFVIFKRLHNDREYPGTGIGLAICKKIVLLHGGKIWVDSVHGEGSAFRFFLPDEILTL